MKARKKKARHNRASLKKFIEEQFKAKKEGDAALFAQLISRGKKKEGGN